MIKQQFERQEIQITQVSNGYLATVQIPHGEIKYSTAFGPTEETAIAALELKVVKT
jgi:hypothetical protein